MSGEPSGRAGRPVIIGGMPDSGMADRKKPAMRRAWADDSYRVRVVVPSREQWETTTRPVSVTDAGFTELDGPTETTRAFW